MASQPRSLRADIGLRSERGPILGSVMLSVGLVAIDATILATAVPSIVNDLGGFAQFPWLFSIYLLAQAVSVPIFGKFSDQFGRKPMHADRRRRRSSSARSCAVSPGACRR